MAEDIGAVGVLLFCLEYDPEEGILGRVVSGSRSPYSVKTLTGETVKAEYRGYLAEGSLVTANVRKTRSGPVGNDYMVGRVVKAYPYLATTYVETPRNESIETFPVEFDFISAHADGSGVRLVTDITLGHKYGDRMPVEISSNVTRKSSPLLCCFATSSR